MNFDEYLQSSRQKPFTRTHLCSIERNFKGICSPEMYSVVMLRFLSNSPIESLDFYISYEIK